MLGYVPASVVLLFSPAACHRRGHVLPTRTASTAGRVLQRHAEHPGAIWQERGQPVVLGARKEAATSSDLGRECLRRCGERPHGAVQLVEYGANHSCREPAERHGGVLHRTAV